MGGIPDKKLKSKTYFIVYKDTLVQRIQMIRYLRTGGMFGIPTYIGILLGKDVIPYMTRSPFKFSSQLFVDFIITQRMKIESDQSEVVLKILPQNRNNRNTMQPDVKLNDYMCSTHTACIEKLKIFFKEFILTEKQEEESSLPRFGTFRIAPSVMLSFLKKQENVKKAYSELCLEVGQKKADRKIDQYGKELLNDRNYFFVLILDWLVDKTLHYFFRKVIVLKDETLKEIDDEFQIVYLPTHRSHFDFLLLPIMLYRAGLNSPFVAAGSHLLKGPLRIGNKISAYFIRRKKMDKLYNFMLVEYLRVHQRFGFSEMVFIEGTRSKAGYTLEPKAGMLSQYISAYLHEKRKKIAFLPVNISYDYIVEGDSFFGELVEYKRKVGTLDKEVENEFLSFKRRKKRKKKIAKVSYFLNQVKRFGP